MATTTNTSADVELPGAVRRNIAATGMKVKQGSARGPAVASVDKDSPDTVEIDDPARFAASKAQTLAHESTHLWQNNLPPAIQAKIPADNPKDPYNFGGTAGLRAARAQGKTILDFPRENQAAIVQYYTSQGGDENAPDAIREAYKPFVDDMRGQKLSTIVPSQPGQKGMETAARPPQGELYDTETYAKGDPAPGDKPVSVDEQDVEQEATPKMLSVDDADVEQAPQPQAEIQSPHQPSNAVVPAPVGAAGPLPAIPQPQVDMSAPSVGQTLTGTSPKTAKPTEKFDGGGAGTDEFLEGAKQLGQAWGDDFHFNSTDAKQGLTKTINGLMSAAGSTILGGSGAGLVDAAGAKGLLGRAGPMAARALAASILGGYVTGKAARYGAQALGLDPDSKDLAEALGNIAGGTLAAHATTFHNGEGVRPEWRAHPEVEDADVEPEEEEEPKQLKAPSKEPEEVTHPSGKVSGIDEKSGLPIVDTSKPSAEEAEEKPAAKPEKPAAEPAKKPPASEQDATAVKPPASAEEDKTSETPAKAPKGEILPPEKKPPMGEVAKVEPPTLEGDVGEKEPESGRVITQPTDKLADAQRLATAAAPELKNKLATITKGIDGADVDGVREEKDRDRALEKSKKQDQPVETISDLLAARIAVDSPKAKDDIVAALKDKFDVVKEEDRFEKGDPDYGFRSHDLQVQNSNGSTAEVQVVPREIADAEKQTHGNYEQGRKAELENRSEDAQAAQAANRKIHDTAMDQFNQRQKQFGAGGETPGITLAPGANKTPGESTQAASQAASGKPTGSQLKLTKGTQVVLPDGRSARVDFHDHGRTGNARVTTEDGTKIDSIAGKDLTPLKVAPLNEGQPWYGFDLDKTLAKYDQFKGPLDIGKPIGGEVAAALKQHLAAGENVRILTARINKDPYGKITRQIQAWTQHYFGKALPVTDQKDPHMVKLYDDRAVAVEPNTGKIIGGDAGPVEEPGRLIVKEPRTGKTTAIPEKPVATPQVAGPAKYVLPSFVTKQYEKPKAPAEEKPEPKESTLTKHLSKKLSEEMPKDNNALRKLVEDFDGKPVDNARLKEGQEALEVAIVRRAREIVAEGKTLVDTFLDLRKLYDSQPNLNIRTSDSIERQAYSTPAPLAYIASQLAGISDKTTVYEPTAGTGMLLIGANPKLTTANELDRGRANYLLGQGFDVRQGDALTNDIAPKSKDVVITNPPFGSVKDAEGKATKVLVDGYKIGQIDHLIAARALDAMKDDGRAVLIIGANKVPGVIATDDRIFFNWLYSHYNVVSHFEVEGGLYAKQGAAWPVRVITIDGRIRSNRFSPMDNTIKRFGKWSEVLDQLIDSDLSTKHPREADTGAVGTVAPSSRDDDAPAVSRPAKSAPPARADRKPRASATVAGSESGAIAKPLPDSEIESAPGLAGTDNDVRPDADVALSDQLPEGAESRVPEKRTPRASRTGRVDLADADSAFQVSYTPASGKKDVGILIPTNMRDPLEDAMETLEDKVGDLDKFATKELGYKNPEELHGALMGLQVDSVAAAIHQIKAGKAVIIADQTGIGKGRQAAAIIRWAVKQGHVPVFFSAKPSLFTDMYGDLADIGTSDVRPFIVNSDEWITLPNGDKAFQNQKGTHKATLDNIRATGKLPAGRNAVFLTYSQINTENTQRGMLYSLANNAVVILDESHNAAGDSKTGEYMGDLLANSKGVVYLSATFAKRPDNMPLYFKTDMGQAIRDPKKIEEIMGNGGLPLQTVISNNLVKAGQMFRRERSYAGVDITTKVDTKNGEAHEGMANKATEVLRAIVQADRAFHNIFVKGEQEAVRKAFGGRASGGGNKAGNVDHTQFTAVVHNFVRQMLMGLKADTAAEEAIAAIKAGKKPLIAVEQTMGSFLNEYAANNNISAGQSLGDFSYKTVLSRALARTRALIVSDAQGNKSRKDIPYEMLDELTKVRYDKAQKLIDKLDLDIPVSPIDWMRKRITDAGHSVAEITGRNLAVDYSKQKPTLTAVSPQEQNDKVETTRRFNDGRTDALILNVAGSTGISLHASEKFRDQRPRHMIIAQPAQDINIFMQMLGRIHRTGQVQLPSYTILNTDLPAEKRPTALLSKKMKSLNANTSSNTESATSIKAPDILNKYGDQVVAEYLSENKTLAELLDVPVKDESGKPAQDIARKATGRLALLPVKVQEAFYSDVEQQYHALIDYLNDTNQNDLEPRTFDYDARLERSQLLLKGEDPSTPFGQDANYGEYSIRAQTKPITAEEVTSAIEKNLGGKEGYEVAEDLVRTLRGQLDKYLATLPEDSTAPPHLQEVALRATNFLRSYPIGSSMMVFVGGDEFPAAITNVESTHKGTGNPFAMSKISVTLATTGTQPRIKIPASQLEKVILSRLRTAPEDIFAEHRAPARETAKIITGNLLAGYGQLRGSQGTIISFTKDDGSVEQGILLPKKFDIATDVTGDYELRTAKQVADFLLKGGEDAEQVGVASNDSNVRITRNPSGGLTISTPKSKARGGEYFLDKKLTGIAGDFVSVGQTMRATVPPGREEEAMRAVLAHGPLYVPKSMAPQAQKFEGSGTTFRSGFLDPELFKTLFPDIAGRMRDWLSDDVTPGDEQREMMRQTRGEMDRRVAAVAHKLEPTRKAWMLRSRTDSKTLWNAVEEGNIASLPAKDQPLAKLFHSGYQPLIKQIQALKPDALQNLIENYFPHIWERPSQARKIIHQVLTGKRPFAGRASFLKQRTIPTMQDGIDMGLTPKSWNPVDQFLTKYSEMAQFLMGHQTLAMMKDAGTAKFVRIGQKPPAGWSQLDDRIGQVISREDNGDLVIRGYYYAPPDAATAFNNFVSRGMAGRSGIYDTLSWANNNMNALQLGISAFHATTTSVNAATSEVALGIKQLSEGKPIKAAGHVLSGAATVPSIVRTLVNGSRLMREYLSPGSYAKMAREASAIAESGGRIKQNTLELKPFQKTVNAFRSGAVGEGLSSIPGTILHATVAPVMEYWVPRMKLGAFYDMAHDVLDQAHKNNYDAEEIRRRMQKAWDSVDNRFGQIVYDNLFWHKGVRDALHLATRSVGWNYGDVRELGGGAADTLKEANKALHGEAPEVTDRMAFAFALPLYTALVGAVLTYLWTGQKPDTWKDYFYPKRKDGTRVSIPGYMKDVIAFREHPVGTVENKLAPIWEMTGEAINNRDFYGTEIRHQDDNPVKQFGEFAAWVARSATPFAFAGTQKLLENKGEDAAFDWHHPIESTKKIGSAIARHPGDLAMGNTGFQPAPAYIQNSAALNMAREYEHSNYTPGTKTQDQADYTKHMHAVEDAYRTNNPNREAIAKQMVKDGKLSEASIFKAQMKATENPLVLAVRSLSIEQALNVYEAASPEERRAIGVQVERKAAGIETDPRLSEEKRDELQESYKRLFGFGGGSKRASLKGAGGS